MFDRFLDYLNTKLCKRFGHHWRYKDYSNYMKHNGDKYDYTAARHCSRCNQNAYFYTEWVNEEKSELDYASEYYSRRKIKINSVVYS